MTCNCPCSQLCEMLGFHIVGGKHLLWMADTPNGRRYRDIWCAEAAVSLSAAYADCPWAGEAPDPVNHALPPLAHRAMNFVAAATKHMSLGAPKVPTGEEARRHSICKACDRYRVADDRCSECGCFLLGSKVAWADQVCPIGKWGEWKNEVVHQ